MIIPTSLPAPAPFPTFTIVRWRFLGSRTWTASPIATAGCVYDDASCRALGEGIVAFLAQVAVHDAHVLLLASTSTAPAPSSAATSTSTGAAPSSAISHRASALTPLHCGVVDGRFIVHEGAIGKVRRREDGRLHSPQGVDAIIIAAATGRVGRPIAELSRRPPLESAVGHGGRAGPRSRRGPRREER